MIFQTYGTWNCALGSPFLNLYAVRKYLNPFKSHRPRNTSIITSIPPITYVPLYPIMLKTYNGKYMRDVLASTTRKYWATRMQYGPIVCPIRPYSGSQSYRP